MHDVRPVYLVEESRHFEEGCCASVSACVYGVAATFERSVGSKHWRGQKVGYDSAKMMDHLPENF